MEDVYCQSGENQGGDANHKTIGLNYAEVEDPEISKCCRQAIMLLMWVTYVFSVLYLAYDIYGAVTSLRAYSNAGVSIGVWKYVTIVIVFLRSLLLLFSPYVAYLIDRSAKAHVMLGGFLLVNLFVYVFSKCAFFEIMKSSLPLGRAFKSLYMTTPLLEVLLMLWFAGFGMFLLKSERVKYMFKFRIIESGG